MSSALQNKTPQVFDTDEHLYLYEQASRLYKQAELDNDSPLLEQALRLAMGARALRPDYIPNLNLLTRIELKRQNYASAEFWVEQGLQLKPKSISLLYSAGHIALSQGNLNDAEEYFTKAVQISRVATKALNSLAHVKYLQGEYVDAFRYYRELVQTQSQNIQVRSQLFQTTSHIVADFYSEELEIDLLAYLDFKDVDYSMLHSLVTSLLKHKFKLSEAGCALDIDAIAQDPLLLKSLTRFHFTDPIFERLLVTLRQSILSSSSSTLSIKQSWLPLSQALAHQIWLNESVWYINEQEQKLVDQLELLAVKLLQLSEQEKVTAAPAMLLVLMYKTLNQCSFANHIKADAWPEFISELLSAQQTEAKTLKFFIENTPSLGASDDKVSLKVQNQYNQNPYPRWHNLGYNQSSDYATALQNNFPKHAHLLPKRNTKLNALVAGCGTGRHAIRLAKYFPELNVTAMDLSHTALAYAQQQAQNLQQKGINFIQGDILNCAALNQEFDLIESSGVLHHMSSPTAGLKALSGILKKGGLIKIALYSKTARQQITQMRQLLGDNRPRDAASIRLMREVILQKEIPGDWSKIYGSPDFYSMSGCRDLVFHEQEHVFDVLELPLFLAEAGLTFIGMIVPPAGQELVRLIGKQAHEVTINEWHVLEQANPDLFAGMYQFYAIKI
ncbi:MAG: methyltransferase domain-containing protein [Venatoribacter sp.]